MRRFAQVIKLRPEGRDEYVARHAAPPEELLEELRGRNITNYSIFIHGDLLFAYLEYTGPDFEADMAGTSAVSERWGEAIRPLQEPLPDRRPGEWWANMEEVFHLD